MNVRCKTHDVPMPAERTRTGAIYGPCPICVPPPSAVDVERVAAWLYEVAQRDEPDPYRTWAKANENVHESTMRVARAVIAAGLDPRRLPR